ncbi:DUF3885 domain-containing protein [Terribacillus sp. FSL K6-0262]|uniref:DUF3885 domain-containing protein n=1 Tax=Terribacillus sp. FSL K6-0262 TaxID=2921447 RepID=UPI0030EEC18A
MHAKDYLAVCFADLELVPSIYHRWHTGMHIALGGDSHQLLDNDQLNMDLFHLVYHQALTILRHLFDSDDELYLAANLYKGKRGRIKKTNLFRPFIRRKKLLYQIRAHTLPYPFEDESLFEYQQFSLKCRPADIRIPALLKAACNKDFPPLKPRFKAHAGYPDIFFINKSKDIIFFIYDDRGCEVVAKEPAALESLSSRLSGYTYDIKTRDEQLPVHLNR